MITLKVICQWASVWLYPYVVLFSISTPLLSFSCSNNIISSLCDRACWGRGRELHSSASWSHSTCLWIPVQSYKQRTRKGIWMKHFLFFGIDSWLYNLFIRYRYNASYFNPGYCNMDGHFVVLWFKLHTNINTLHTKNGFLNPQI